MIYVASIWFALILIINIARDERYYKTHRKINHNHRFWVRCLFTAPSIVLFTLALTGRLILEWSALAYFVLSSAMVAFTWAFLFDTTLNILRGEHWNFPGSPGPEDGIIEKRLRQWPWLQWVKVFGSGILIFVYIKLAS